MHCEIRIEEFVASLREDARDLTLPDRDKRALLALAEHVRTFTPPDELAATVIAEEAELHGVRPEQLRPNGHRSTRDVTAARYAVVRRLGALGFSTRRIYARDLGETWTATQLSSTRTLVVDAIRHVQAGLRSTLDAGSRELVDRGMRNVLEILRMGERRFHGVVRPLQLEQALRFEHTLHGVLSSRLRQYEASVTRYGTRMISEFERAMQVGIVGRRSLGQMVDVLAAPGGPGGVFQQQRYLAACIVRTEMLASYNHGAQAAIEVEVEDFPDLQRKILAHHDRRTAADSLFVDGEVRGVKDFFADGAGRRYLVPPARPNDREFVIPWRQSWETPPWP